MQLDSTIAAVVTSGASGLGAATARALTAKGGGAPQNVKDALAASVPFPKCLGRPDEYAALALTMNECGYFNGEDLRLDGGIRMVPR